MNLAEATPTSHAPSMNRLKIVTVILIDAFIGTVFLKRESYLYSMRLKTSIAYIIVC